MLTDEQFTSLAHRYMDTVFRVALNYLKDPVESEDVTQNVFEKLLGQTKPFASEEHIRYWLIHVTLNECRRVFRAPWHHQESLEKYIQTLTVEMPEHRTILREVMALPKKYRLPIYLHYYEGYSTSEIGQLLKMPKGTVCTNLRRGRELLKENLQEANDHV